MALFPMEGRVNDPHRVREEPMRATTWLPSLLPLVLSIGCGDFRQLLEWKETLDDYTNSTVVTASILGVAPSSDDRVDIALSRTDLGSGVRASAWLVDARGVGDLDGAGLGGQPVRVSVDGRGVGMEEVRSGEYVADGDSGLEYRPQTEARLEIDGADGPRGLVVGLPPAPEFSTPEVHAALEPLRVDLQGQDFDASLVMVVDVLTGGVTWQQTPTGARALYEFARADGSVGWVEIPGEAFPGESVYAVGVAGTWNSDAETFEGVNIALTTGFAGRFRFETTCTFTDPDLCDAEPPL